jgi:hypothetical protein
MPVADWSSGPRAWLPEARHGSASLSPEPDGMPNWAICAGLCPTHLWLIPRSESAFGSPVVAAAWSMS